MLADKTAKQLTAAWIRKVPLVVAVLQRFIAALL
jgi:hypothetical protein